MVENATIHSPKVHVPRTTSADVVRTPGAVVVTGICGRLGKHLARVLTGECRMVGFHRRPFLDKPKDIDHAQVDIRRKKLKDLFRSGDIGAVVHLGIMHDPRASASDHHSWNVAGFTKLLEYIA